MELIEQAVAISATEREEAKQTQKVINSIGTGAPDVSVCSADAASFQQLSLDPP
jgi:hypothetical protein